MKTHLRQKHQSAPLCGVLKGYYAELKLTEDARAVTCRRCLERLRAIAMVSSKEAKP